MAGMALPVRRDELVDQGVYFDNVSMVARRLRAGLGPRVKLAINIVPRDCTLWPSGCHGNGWPQYTHVPPELDLLSFDGYNWTNGTACAPPRRRRVPAALSGPSPAPDPVA